MAAAVLSPAGAGGAVARPPVQAEAEAGGEVGRAERQEKEAPGSPGGQAERAQRALSGGPVVGAPPEAMRTRGLLLYGAARRPAGRGAAMHPRPPLALESAVAYRAAPGSARPGSKPPSGRLPSRWAPPQCPPSPGHSARGSLSWRAAPSPRWRGRSPRERPPEPRLRAPRRQGAAGRCSAVARPR